MTHTFQTSQRVGTLLCEALGVDPRKVAELHLYLRPGEAATVSIREYIDEPMTDKLVTAARRFTLVEKTEPE